MEVKHIMTQPAISIGPEESAEVAARTLAHYNIGFLPVCEESGKLCGLVTDRDLVTRCMASGKTPANTKIKEVMSTRITSVSPGMQVSAAAQLMGDQQVRRLPVVENGKIRGILSLGDLAKRQEMVGNATNILSEISQNPAGRRG